MHINTRTPTRAGRQQGKYFRLDCFPSAHFCGVKTPEMVCHRLSLGFFFCPQDTQMCCLWKCQDSGFLHIPSSPFHPPHGMRAAVALQLKCSSYFSLGISAFPRLGCV